MFSSNGFNSKGTGSLGSAQQTPHNFISEMNIEPDSRMSNGMSNGMFRSNSSGSASGNAHPFGNSTSTQSRQSSISSRSTKLSSQQQQELQQLLTGIENLNVTRKMIETFSNQLVTADILMHFINFSGLSKIRLTVGETALIWSEIVKYRLNTGEVLPPQF